MGAEDLIGWTVNRTWSEAADFFAVSQFRRTFYRPDIVKRVLADAISGLVVTAIEPPRTSNLVLAHLPPVVRIVSPGERSVAASNDVTVTYVVRSPSGMPVKKVSLYVDGVPVTTETSNGQWVLDANKEFVGKLKARIPSRDVEISLVAETEESSSLPAVSKLLWWKQGRTRLRSSPICTRVLIGVGSYADASLKLQSPPNDVDDFEILLNQQKARRSAASRPSS